MTKKEKVKLIKDLIKHYQELTANFDQIDKLFGADYDSNFFTAFWKAFDSYVELVQDTVGDHFQWVSWFIYDNQCGKANMTCILNGNNCKVKTVEKLVELIEDSQ